MLYEHMNTEFSILELVCFDLFRGLLGQSLPAYAAEVLGKKMRV